MSTKGQSHSMMRQQMLFARPSGSWEQDSPAWTTGSNNSSPRRVTFAVQNAPPSPVVYRSRRHQAQDQQSPYAADVTATTEISSQQRRLRSQPKRNVSSSRKAAVSKPRSRRPGWDDDVSHSSTLFDASLKKSLLFQPRAGDRRKEEEAEKQGALPKKVTVRSRRKETVAPMTPVRYRPGPSSVYAQQRQNVTHWPQRRTKDFVRQNIELLTGRPVDTRLGRSGTRSASRENVFERLSAPRASKALLRSQVLLTLPESERSPRPIRSPSVSSLSPPRSSAQSPVLTIDPSPPEKPDSPRSATPSRRLGVVWSSPYASPQRSQQSFSSRHSSAPRSNLTNRSSGASSRTQRYDNYPARVFGVLDCDNEKRIGVSQILQGLRLLGLPATHNQISDYVYLIHEGRHNSIDLEEWEILVGTLDAASRPSGHSPRSTCADQGGAIPSRSPSIRSISEYSPYNSMPPSRSPFSKVDHGNLAPKRQDRAHVAPSHDPDDDQDQFSTSVLREAIVTAEHQPITDDDPYLEEIQNRIDGMFERAQATAALRWTSAPGNNQFENDPDHSRSDRILKRAASVVYSLRASLFPLVHQAEATLRDIQQRHGSKLSLFLPPGDMTSIAQNSDVLASAILDDILLDTVQLLNEEDKQQSRRQLEARHSDQLDNIMARIQEIEREEDIMIQQGLALSVKTPGTKCDLPTTTFHPDMAQRSVNPPQEECVTQPNLVLPLEVVMNINVPDNNTDPLSHRIPGHINEVVAGSAAFNEDDVNPSELETAAQLTLFAGTPVKTSILQGKRLQPIERRRHKFQHHRRLVESSLAETGMAQFAVIEILEEMLVGDLIEETAAELNDTVLSMSDILLTKLL